jgi:hypothetical protein
MISTREYAALRRRKQERDRYHSDPVYRAKRLARCARRHAERYRTDEAYRAKLKAVGRMKRNPRIGDL